MRVDEELQPRKKADRLSVSLKFGKIFLQLLLTNRLRSPLEVKKPLFFFFLLKPTTNRRFARVPEWRVAEIVDQPASGGDGLNIQSLLLSDGVGFTLAH